MEIRTFFLLVLEQLALLLREASLSVGLRLNQGRLNLFGLMKRPLVFPIKLLEMKDPLVFAVQQ